MSDIPSYRDKRRERERKRREDHEESIYASTHVTAEESSVEAVADAVLTAAEARQAESEGISAREYVREEWGVDPEEYDSDAELQAAMSDSQSEDG